MLSWNTFRTFFAILLFIPIVHLAILLSRDMVAKLNTSPAAWEDEVAAYVETFQNRDLPNKPIIVIGGQRVKLWHGLEDSLSPLPAVTLGLGDATIDDIIHYHSQLVSYFQPRAVVLFPGNSEFHIRDDKSARELLAAVQAFIELDKSYDIPRQYYLITPLKSPLYPGDHDKIDEVTRLLKQLATAQEDIWLLDANALLARADGSPNPDFFRIDGSNLNEQGYLRLSVMLQTHLKAGEMSP